MLEIHSPVPPFTQESAEQKVRGAEDGWNSCNPIRVSRAYTIDTSWRNRSEFVMGRAEVIEFLTRKWNKEFEYRLIKEIWTYSGARIAVRFAYEWHDDSENWFRSYGNENWEFDANGLMKRRFACINDLRILKSDRKMQWDRNGPRPVDHPGLSDLGL
jgi:nuclear transport factor 2 (NTF2) superfamily protein